MQICPVFAGPVTYDDFHKEIDSLKATIQTLSDEIKTLKSKESIDCLSGEEQMSYPTNQKLSPNSDSTITLISDSVTQSNTCTIPSITSTVTSLLAEEKEKDRRRLNLIVHQLAEPTETDPQQRKECDIKETSDIIQKYLGVSVSVTNAIRLGNKGAKPRLLKISVGSKQQKASILKNCTKLRNKEYPSNIQKIYITPDLTPKEQQANKALRSRLDEMNKPNKLYKIKNGKIVRRED